MISPVRLRPQASLESTDSDLQLLPAWTLIGRARGEQRLSPSGGDVDNTWIDPDLIDHLTAAARPRRLGDRLPVLASASLSSALLSSAAAWGSAGLGKGSKIISVLLSRSLRLTGVIMVRLTIFNIQNVDKTSHS